MQYKITNFNDFDINFNSGKGRFSRKFLQSEELPTDHDDYRKTIRRIISEEAGIAKGNIRNIVWEWHHDYDLGDEVCEFTFSVVGGKAAAKPRMDVKVIDKFGVERDYGSLEEARDDIDDEYIGCFDSEELSDSLLRLLDRIINVIEGRSSIDQYKQPDGSIVIKDE